MISTDQCHPYTSLTFFVPFTTRNPEDRFYLGKVQVMINTDQCHPYTSLTMLSLVPFTIRSSSYVPLAHHADLQYTWHDGRKYHLPPIFEPRCEKTGLRGFRPGPTQTGLYNHRRWLEA